MKNYTNNALHIEISTPAPSYFFISIKSLTCFVPLAHILCPKFVSFMYSSCLSYLTKIQCKLFLSFRTFLLHSFQIWGKFCPNNTYFMPQKMKYTSEHSNGSKCFEIAWRNMVCTCTHPMSSQWNISQVLLYY